jgi:hypothetical protein
MDALQQCPLEYFKAIVRVLKLLKIICDAQTVPTSELSPSIAPALFGANASQKHAQVLSDLVYGAEKFVHTQPKSTRVFHGMCAA